MGGGAGTELWHKSSIFKYFGDLKIKIAKHKNILIHFKRGEAGGSWAPELLLIPLMARNGPEDDGGGDDDEGGGWAEVVPFLPGQVEGVVYQLSSVDHQKCLPERE